MDRADGWQVHVWSIWLTVIWAAGCITSLLVQAIPKILIRLIVLFGGHVELFKIQLEVLESKLLDSLYILKVT